MKPSIVTRIRAGVVALALVAVSTAAAAWAQGKPSQDLAVSAEQVEGYLQSEFPRQFQALGGLVSMTASNPQLTIPDGGDRVQMQFDASASGNPLGRVWLSSGLRYDADKMAVFLDAPSVDRVVPTHGGELRSRDRQLVSLFLQDYASTEPLYQLDPKLLANFGNLRVESTRVEGGKIVVHFNQPVGMPELNDAP